ncbi:MAG TPA: DUF4157 domain-containing protein [Longimicrobium sp.]|nr:DUF4157 domain-containing protein [Longimicrobium sp.]
MHALEPHLPVPARPLLRTAPVVQRCACGGKAGGSGECEECKRRRLQRKAIDGASPGFSFGGIPVLAQARLRVGAADDPLEREADRVADAVVAGGTARVSAGAARAGGGFPVQREEADEAAPAEAVEPSEAEELGAEPGKVREVVEEDGGLDEDEDDEDIIGDDSGHPKLRPGAAAPASPVRVPRGGGEPLDPQTRGLMEERMGHSFGRVRVHADGEAAGAAERINAHAFTVGSHVYFNERRYAPQTAPGLRLLAHELAHVVQQSADDGVLRRAPKGKGAAKKPRKKRKGKPCDGACAPSKVDKLYRNDCDNATTAKNNLWITHLQVKRADHKVIATWSDSSKTTWACSPSTTSGKDGKVATPLGPDVVGVKCSKCHTNRHGDGMGYFTGFRSQGRAIGFHNSQRVGSAYESHGCVRVSCSVALIIRDNTTSDKTTIRVVA